MIEFLKFYSGRYKFYKTFSVNAHWLILRYLGLIDTQKVKEKIWTKFFFNASIREFENKADFFSQNILPSFLYHEALNKIVEHKKNGDRIIVISASAEDWLKPWCKKNNLELIATQLEKQNNRLTGKIVGNNCKGSEKVIRIKHYLNLKDYNYIFAYGDSNGDKEMLAIAHYPFYRKFKH